MDDAVLILGIPEQIQEPPHAVKTIIRRRVRRVAFLVVDATIEKIYRSLVICLGNLVAMVQIQLVQRPYLLLADLSVTTCPRPLFFNRLPVNRDLFIVPSVK